MDTLRLHSEETGADREAVSNGSRTVPPAAALEMPTQSLKASAVRRRASHPHGRLRQAARSLQTSAARVLTFGGCVSLTIYGGHQMVQVVSASGVTSIEWAFSALFAATFGWISLSATSALSGLLFGERNPRPTDDAPPLSAHHALVMPVYNEDPINTSAALDTMAQALVAAGVARHFEIFVLSDTSQPCVWVREIACIDALRERLSGAMPVWYRRRTDNHARKAGNVRDFVERWGARYEGMLILDADSLLTADTIIALATELERDGSLGILQSVPILAGGDGFFARLQQFAGSVYGATVARGLAAWQGDDGNYWGHNAMIRVRAFAEASGLPVLPGGRPFGGDILSHDFVEAALVRKAGWRVSMLPGLRGSWENSPPSLLDVAVRDRRWAQGNIQHLAILPQRGIAWPNRVHFLIGVMSYVASPLWLAMMAVGVYLSVQLALVQPNYFPEVRTLFPHWPAFDSARMIGLFLLTFATLLLPKFIGVLRVLSSRTLADRYGGRAAFLCSAALELLMSTLFAPIMMLMHSRQLWEILRGRDAGWTLQRRHGDSLPWSMLVRRHASHTILGVLMLVALAILQPELLIWMSPVIAGLMMAIPPSRISGSCETGRRLRQHGLLITPEETAIPVEFDQRDQLAATYRRVAEAVSVRQVLTDDSARSRHAGSIIETASHLRGRPDPHWLMARSKLEEASSIDEALTWLTPTELIRVLSDRHLLAISRQTAVRDLAA